MIPELIVIAFEKRVKSLWKISIIGSRNKSKIFLSWTLDMRECRCGKDCWYCRSGQDC